MRDPFIPKRVSFCNRFSRAKNWDEFAATANSQKLIHTYDNVGNVKTITDTLTAQTANYTYDDLNRLLAASIPSVYAHSWTYNSIGNMLTRNDNNGNVTYSYNDAAHKHAVTQAGANYFCYDANGT